jgi:hypothetical protein
VKTVSKMTVSTEKFSLMDGSASVPVSFLHELRNSSEMAVKAKAANIVFRIIALVILLFYWCAKIMNP